MKRTLGRFGGCASAAPAEGATAAITATTKTSERACIRPIVMRPASPNRELFAKCSGWTMGDMKPTFREPTPADGPDIGRLAFDAFGRIARQHNMPLDFPAQEMAVGLAEFMVHHPQL